MDKGGAKRPQECGGKFSKRYNRAPPRFPMRKLIARSFAFYRGKANSERENVSSSGQLFSLSLLYYYVYVFLFFFFFPPLPPLLLLYCHDFEKTESRFGRRKKCGRRINLVRARTPLRSPFCNKMCGPAAISAITKWVVAVRRVASSSTVQENENPPFLRWKSGTRQKGIEHAPNTNISFVPSFRSVSFRR